MIFGNHNDDMEFLGWVCGGISIALVGLFVTVVAYLAYLIISKVMKGPNDG